jgi:hypothetical protein
MALASIATRSERLAFAVNAAIVFFLANVAIGLMVAFLLSQSR